MSDFVHPKDIPKKYYRYFLKGLAYYTCHLNKACTLADLQAYVFLKNLQQVSETYLTFLSHEVMGQLVSTGLAYNHNGYYRLNDLLRFANGSSSKQPESINQTHDSELSSGSGLRKMVNFCNTVTMWPTDTLDGVVTLTGAVSNPTPYLRESGSITDLEDIDCPANKTDAENKFGSDTKDEDNDKDKSETNPSASHGKTEPDSLATDDDADDEDLNNSQNGMKQTPDNERNDPESEDDTPKQE